MKVPKWEPKIEVKKPVGRPKSETSPPLPPKSLTDSYRDLLDHWIEAGIKSDDAKRLKTASGIGGRDAELKLEGRIEALHDVRRLLAGEEDALL